jgi:aldose 1-epimerase
MTTTPQPPTDAELTNGSSRAEIVTAGARLRRLTIDGVDITAPDPGPALALEEYWGVVLAPWPNRLRDGTLDFGGSRYRFAINDPATATALHGTLSAAPFVVTAKRADRVELRATTPPAPPSWPSTLGVTVSYQLDGDGMIGSLTAANLGSSPCPAGLGVHPYLAPGGPVDGCQLTIPAGLELTTDSRLLPVGEIARQTGRMQLEGRQLDTTYGQLSPSGGDKSAVTLHRADGHEVEVWAGPSARWFQVFTCDTLPEPRRRAAIAIEPMTCAPDGLNGPEPTVLGPGQQLTLQWGLRLA